MPIEQGQQITFQNPHAPAFLRLIKWEGLGRLLLIVKLGENQFADARHEWTRCVSIILGGKRLPLVCPGFRVTVRRAVILDAPRRQQRLRTNAYRLAPSKTRSHREGKRGSDGDHGETAGYVKHR